MENSLSYLYIIFIFLLSTIGTSGQNFVPNSSFEQVKIQPCSYLNNERLSVYFPYWETPTTGSTDPWFYSSDTTTFCNQNTALFGFKPHSGSYCAGLLTSSILPADLPRGSSSLEYREYAQTKLTRPLAVDTLYYAEMYVLALSASELFSNNLGICFSTDSLRQYLTPTGSFTYKLPCIPLINEHRVLNRPNEWVKVAGCLKAKAPYRHITIGNFYDDKSTLFMANPRVERFKVQPYYLIDDILVRKATVQELPRAFGRNIDTTLCQDASLLVTPLLSDQTRIRWENGSTLPRRIITQPGIYLITASNGECESTDTLRVRREIKPVLPTDTLLCRGEVLQISASQSQNTYKWSTGSTDSTIRVTESGMYRLNVPSSYCQLADTINVIFVDCPGFIPNIITPNGDGKNDTFAIDQIQLFPWEFTVYNRWGKDVYYSPSYKSDWGGEHLPSGVYFYILHSQKLQRTYRGWIEIIR